MNLLYGLLLLLLLLVAALTVGAVGHGAAHGMLRRNRFAGIRTRRALADDETWKLVYQSAQPWIIASCLAMGLGGMVAFGARDHSVAGTAAVVTVLFSIALIVAGAAVGHQELRRSR
ncbi:SdpI family protein [Actinomadura fulvescens]|uniref:SdpI family protein n=1 Tax=Actinomadura fulvescens TaxID=46160 RepID=A0ABN3QNT9_9ACTN